MPPQASKPLGPASASEPKLFRKQTGQLKGRGRQRGEVCDNPRGEVAEGEEESEEAREGRARLQRMKVQSRRTFKFRKTRKRERQEGGTVATIGGEMVPVVPPPKVTIRHIHNIKSHQNPHYVTPYPNPLQVKSTSMTAAVLRRARQGKKPARSVEICIGGSHSTSCIVTNTKYLDY